MWGSLKKTRDPVLQKAINKRKSKKTSTFVRFSLCIARWSPRKLFIHIVPVLNSFGTKNVVSKIKPWKKNWLKIYAINSQKKRKCQYPKLVIIPNTIRAILLYVNCIWCNITTEIVADCKKRNFLTKINYRLKSFIYFERNFSVI